MRLRMLGRSMLPLFLLVMASACSSTTTKSPDVRLEIRSSLDQAGLESVSVDQDRDKGVVTLGGKVPTEGHKKQAGAIATSRAGGQVVANQIAVVFPEDAEDSNAVNAALDQGIEKNLDAALIQRKLQDDVRYKVKNAVVTLMGDVNSQSLRQDAEKTAATVPNVKQVVNELQVKDQKATSR